MGLGQSRQKFFYIPLAYNDFIFSIIGEELGFIGAFIVMAFYVVIIWRGLRIAINAKDQFGAFLAIGITSLIAIQTLVHIAVVTSSMPPTGIVLPFISAGGTSLLIFMGAVGILLNISKNSL
jgi:cell division protein FtsW